MENRQIINGNRISSNTIEKLNDNEIFVFGSNIQGMHGGGAAWYAHKNFGAEWGIGEGLTGRTYALPTMEGTASMKKAIAHFIDCAKQHPELTFLVTAVGCGIAGYTPKEVAPMFREALSVENIYLPKVFIDELSR
jgi:O-acetyl-ADP-ribose deacetylase (regulator of RNase III)